MAAAEQKRSRPVLNFFLGNSSAWMEEGPLEYNKNDFIETLTGNRVSKKSILCGSQNIRLSGKVALLNYNVDISMPPLSDHIPGDN
jgi:hypothetical protein